MGNILWNSLALFENSGLTAEKNSSFYFVEFSKNWATCKDKFVRLPSFSKSRQKSNSTFLKTRQKNSSFAPYGSLSLLWVNRNQSNNALDFLFYAVWGEIGGVQKTPFWGSCWTLPKAGILWKLKLQNPTICNVKYMVLENALELIKTHIIIPTLRPPSAVFWGSLVYVTLFLSPTSILIWNFYVSPVATHTIFIVKFLTWRASIVLNWLSLYPNSYYALFICYVCMISIYLHFI